MSFIRPRTEAYVKGLNVESLTEKDLAWLDICIQKSYDEVSKEELLADARENLVQLWRLGNEEGLIISEFVERKGKLQFWLPHLAGKGIFKKFDELDSFFAAYARKEGCSVIRWLGTEKGVKRMYSRRWKEIASIYEREL